MKHIMARDILPYFKDMLSLLREAEAEEGSTYVQAALMYLIKTSEIKDKQEFLEFIHEGLSPETEVTIMTLEQQWREEGRAKGRSEGMEQGQIEAKKTIAQRLFESGLTLEKVQQITDLSMKELKEIECPETH